MQKTDGYIANRLKWKAGEHGLPGQFAFYFKDLTPDVQKSLSAEIDVSESGTPVLFSQGRQRNGH